MGVWRAFSRAHFEATLIRPIIPTVDWGCWLYYVGLLRHSLASSCDRRTALSDNLMFLPSLDLIKCLAQASSFFHFKPLHPCRHGEAVAAGDSASLGWLAFAVDAGGGAGGASAGGGLSY